MNRPLRAMATIALALPLTGCCSLSLGLASLFCGARPDPWVQIAYGTPEESLTTFLGAIARDDSEVICKSLSVGFKEGIGLLECDIIWQEIKEMQPGIHLADLASVQGFTRLSPASAEYTLEIAGEVMKLKLVRLDYYEYQIDVGAEEPAMRSGYLEEALGTYVLIGPDGVAVVRVPRSGLPNVFPDDLDRVTMGREWKIDGFPISTRQ